MNSFHKLDTLIAALQAFRAGLAEECELYKQRERDRRVSATKSREAEARTSRHRNWRTISRR